MPQEVYLIDGVRTAIGNFGGSLAPVRTDDLAAIAIKGLLEKNPGLDPLLIEDVILGCANQAGEDNRNVARMSGLLAGLPYQVAGETVNRLCASGLAAVINASRAIKDGSGDIYIAGGVENMTRGPWVISKASAPFGRDSEMYDSSFGWRFINPKLDILYGTDSMGNTAENLAELYAISREDQDQFAIQSYTRSAKAWSEGKFAEEVVPVSIPQRKGDPIIFAEDEEYKAVNFDRLPTLPTVFKKEEGTVTAANASTLNDGASALILVSKEKMEVSTLLESLKL